MPDGKTRKHNVKKTTRQHFESPNLSAREYKVHVFVTLAKNALGLAWLDDRTAFVRR